MTVRHLLNQTSGLPQLSGLRPLADFDSSPDASERQARALSTLELTRPVGSAFEYSNMNYNLLGLIIEAASGESYEAYVQNHIFAPLEMIHSYTSQAETEQGRMAVGHRYWFATPFAEPNLPLPRGSLPSALLISSSEDMAHYLIAHLNEGRYYDNVEILSPAGIAELHRPAVEVNAIGFPSGHYGMGWFTEETGRTRIVSHPGTLPNFFAYMAILPEQKKGVVLLVNANQLMMDVAQWEVGAGVAALLAGERRVPNRFGTIIPWALRDLPLIPALQIVSVAATLRRLGRWHQDPSSHPLGGRKWGRYILLPLIPDLLVSLPLLGLLWTGTLDVMLLYMPDVSWIAIVCGSFALSWMFLRTGLVVWTLRKGSVA